MKYIRYILTLAILLSASLAHAQTKLDDIHLDLSSGQHWAKQLDRFKPDSTVRMQSWFVENDKGQKMLGAIVVSAERSEMPMSFKELISKKLNSKEKGHQVSLLEKGKTAADYSYALFKVIVKKESKDDPGSMLTALIQTPTSVHICTIRSIKSKLSDDFIIKWGKILKNPEITSF